MNYFEKTGYLNSDFKIFYLLDKNKKSFEYHYHDFYKVLIFISGNVSYHIEGKSYNLKTNDIILVNPGEIHRPIVHDNSPYERIIIYISPDFFYSYKEKGFDLSFCFNMVHKDKSNLINFSAKRNYKLFNEISELKNSFKSDNEFNELYKKASFIKFLILLNDLLKSDTSALSKEIISNNKILDILLYINENLSNNITIDNISSKFFLNRSYLMHLFKKETGYTIIEYITEKRLFKAKNMLMAGHQTTEVCFLCGFNNYSTFFRAFKKEFNISPNKASQKLIYL